MLKSYSSIMWFDSIVTSIRKLNIVYNNGLRKILNSSKFNSASKMFVNLNILSFDELFRKHEFNFRNRFHDFYNSLVKGIVKSSLQLFIKISVE